MPLLLCIQWLVCMVDINLMCVIWSTGVEVEYGLHNEHYYLRTSDVYVKAV